MQRDTLVVHTMARSLRFIYYTGIDKSRLNSFILIVVGGYHFNS